MTTILPAPTSTIELTPLAGAVRTWDAPGGIPGLLRDVAAEAGPRLAVDGSGVSLSFDELIGAADRLAAELARHVEPGGLVGLRLERSPALAVAELACLIAQVAFVPFGTTEPSARLALMRETADLGVLVVDSLADELPDALTDLPALAALAPDPRSPVGSGPNRPTCDYRTYDPDAPAYVLFTSGSTGKPKGVLVSHGALLNRLLWGREYFGIGPGDVVLQKTPYTFDVSLPEILGPPIAGARTHYLAPGAHNDPAKIAAAIQEHDVSFCHFVPSMLEVFLGHPAARACRSLRHVQTSGEGLPAATARRFGRVLPARLHNTYGPTEAAVEVTFWEVPDPARCERVLIGSPVDNTDLYLLDERQRPVAAGEAGELYLAGVQLAAGYLGRPDLTDKAFVTLADGTRAYRSGDAMRLVDGELEFVSRIDDQVKVRGVRIELGEVEAALGTHPSVDWAVALTVTGLAGTELIAAIHDESDGAELAPLAPELVAALTAHLAACLPEAYCPSRFLALGELPLTRNGKLDRAGLRDRLAAASAAAEANATTIPALETASPGSDIEKTSHGCLSDGEVVADLLSDPSTGPLAELWWQRFGAGASAQPDASERGFLSLGGTSIAAAALAGAMFRRTGTRIPLAWLLVDDVSLTELARRLDDAVAEAAVEAERTSSDTGVERLPLLPEQRRLWLLERITGSIAAYNVLDAIEVPAILDPDRVRRAVACVQARHPALRTRLIEDGAEDIIQIVDAPGSAPLSAETTTTRGYDTALAAMLSRLQWHDHHSGGGRAFSVGMLSDPESPRTALAVSVNHAFFDAGSAALFWSDFAAAYETGAEPGEASTAGYGAVVAERVRSYPETIEADLAHFSERLSGPATPLHLPFAARTGDLAGGRGTSVSRDLDADSLAAVVAAGAGAGARSSAVLLAAYSAVLASWVGEDRVTVGVPMDTRQSVAEAETVGFFVATVPVPVSVGSDAAFADLAAGVQSELDAAARHRGVAFDDIVRRVRPDRDPSRNPLFQAWFNDLSAFGNDGPALAGATSARLALPEIPALFDVGIYVHAAPGGGLRLEAVCGGARTDAAAAAHLLDQILALLSAFATQPGGQLGELLAAAPGTQRKTAITRAPAVSGGGPIAARFLTVADVAAGSTALYAGGERVTYGELAEAVRGAAATLSSGSGPVGILARRSPSLPIALLACYAVGRPAVLLDAATPAAYLERCLAAAGVGEMIDAADPLLPRDGLTVAAWAPSPGAETVAAVTIPDGTSHLLATSGTTGVPKLIPVDATSVLTALLGYAEALDLGPADRFIALSGPGHDPILRDVLLPLLIGASVTLPAPGDESNPRDLATQIAAVGPTILHLTPGRAELLSTALEVAGRTVPETRAVVCCGEPLRWGTARRAAVAFPAAAIHNGYGLTEVAQLASLRPCREDELRSAAPEEIVPIGTGTGARRLEVRQGDRVCAVGQVGEITVVETIAGGVRTTPTGDLGRLGLHGEYEWIGRADRQLSISGYRVESEEIERELRAHPAVRDALVVHEHDEHGGSLVQGFIVAQPGIDVDAAEVRERLATRLPGAFVPAAIHLVARIELGRTGKPDPAATALAARLAEGVPGPARPGTAPTSASNGVARLRRSSPVLDELVAAVAEVRPGRGIDPSENFFEAGLGSFELLRLHHALTRRGYELELTDLFRWPNLNRLEAALRRETR